MTIPDDLKAAEKRKYAHLMPGRCARCDARVVLAFKPLRWADPDRALRAHECSDVQALHDAAVDLRRAGGVANVALAIELEAVHDKRIEAIKRERRAARRDAG